MDDENRATPMAMETPTRQQELVSRPTYTLQGHHLGRQKITGTRGFPIETCRRVLKGFILKMTHWPKKNPLDTTAILSTSILVNHLVFLTGEKTRLCSVTAVAWNFHEMRSPMENKTVGYCGIN